MSLGCELVDCRLLERLVSGASCCSIPMQVNTKSSGYGLTPYPRDRWPNDADWDCKLVFLLCVI